MAARTDLDCDFRLLLLAGATRASDPSRVIESPYRSPLNPLAHLRALKGCLKERPAVLIASLWKSAPVALLAKLLRPRMRLVFFMHAERHVHLIDAWLSKLTARFADEVWADSGKTLSAGIIKFDPARSRVISFVTQRFLPSGKPEAPPRPNFVTWSRLTHQKGIDRALHFIAALQENGIKARFDVWGPDRGELASLRALADKLGVADGVAFRGAVAPGTLGAIAAEASFFLQLSRFEGMAMGVVEGMQMGLVPVVTPVGEIGEYVKDGESGVLVDAADLGPALEKVTRTLKDPDEYRRMRANAIRVWSEATLYPDDVCAAAVSCLTGRGAAAIV
jgi:glycosyltransferase involved in cell wall biosynthesis